MAEILVTHVSIGQSGVEIGYNEVRDRGPAAVLFRTIMIERTLIEDEMEALMETLQIMVDRGLTDIQKQPDTIPFRR